MWAPRMVKGTLDVLSVHYFSDLLNIRHPERRITPFARKQAALQLLQVIGGIAGVLGLAGLLKPDSVEWDPRSADFGKIRVGNTRFDVTGGMGSLVILAWRLWVGETKSSTTGRITKMNTGKWGSKNRQDVILDFLNNKLTPVMGEVSQHLKGEDRNAPWVGGRPQKPTVLGSVKNLTKPFAARTAEEILADPEAANIVAAMIIEGLGASAQTYPDKPSRRQKRQKRPKRPSRKREQAID